MKIVALTDIHGAYKMAEAIVQKESPDVVVIGGDLTTVGTLKEVEECVLSLQCFCKHILCIAGNMDLPQHDTLYERMQVSINARAREIDDIGFFGVSAAPISHLRTPYEISEEDIARRIYSGYEMLGKVRRTILVAHAPPYGTRVDITDNANHAGSTSVRDFIEEEKPDLVICGHIHEARGHDVLGPTKIVNCGFGANGCYTVAVVGQDIIIHNKQHFNY